VESGRWTVERWLTVLNFPLSTVHYPLYKKENVSALSSYSKKICCNKLYKIVIYAEDR